MIECKYCVFKMVGNSKLLIAAFVIELDAMLYRDLCNQLYGGQIYVVGPPLT